MFERDIILYIGLNLKRNMGTFFKNSIFVSIAADNLEWVDCDRTFIVSGDETQVCEINMQISQYA